MADRSEALVLKEESSLGITSAGSGATVAVALHDLAQSPERFINRELSWLHFNRRVLEEAENEHHPVLERLRFLSISASNLDEFYMVRVAGLKAQVALGVASPSQEGLSPAQQLGEIATRVQELMRDQQHCWRSLSDELRAAGIAVVAADELTTTEKAWLEERFLGQMFPVLTPLAIDPAHPFPFIPNLGLCLALALTSKEEPNDEMEAIVPLPPQLDRFTRLPGSPIRFVLLEDVVMLFLDRLFPGYTPRANGVFRVIRDSEMEIDEEAEDLVKTFESALKRRRKGIVIRLAVSAEVPESLRRFVCEKLKVKDNCINRILYFMSDAAGQASAGREAAGHLDFVSDAPHGLRVAHDQKSADLTALLVHEIQRHLYMPAGGGNKLARERTPAFESFQYGISERRVAGEHIFRRSAQQFSPWTPQETLDRSAYQHHLRVPGEQHQSVLKLGHELVHVVFQRGKNLLAVAHLPAQVGNLQGDQPEFVVFRFIAGDCLGCA